MLKTILTVINSETNEIVSFSMYDYNLYSEHHMVLDPVTTITTALKKCEDKVDKTADLLCISESELCSKLIQLKIKR